MTFEDLQKDAAINYGANMGRVINRSCVDSILKYGETARDYGIAEGRSKLKSHLKELVIEVENNLDNLDTKNLEYALSDLLTTIKGL